MRTGLSELYQNQPSLVHHLDPRVKVVITLVFIVTVSLVPEGTWWAFGIFPLLLLTTIFTARLDVRVLMRRSLIAMPFLLAALSVPFTLPGPELFKMPLVGWAVSRPGLIRFGTILIRALLSVYAVILLTASTRMKDLLWALGALRFPRPLITIISLMYRYLFVLVEEAQRTLIARAARSPKVSSFKRPSILWLGRVTGAMIGNLFLRAISRGERVYASMLSRGYDGTARTLVRFEMTVFDWTVGIGTLAILGIPVLLAHMS